MTRRLHYLIAPLVCLALFWRALFGFFLRDDYSWLGFARQVHGASDLLHFLFSPQAQGTVRVISERLLFLLGDSILGLHAVPYHVLAMATFLGSLTLATWLGERITGSKAAGAMASVLWASSAAMTEPLVWTSSYNQILSGFLMLAALASRDRWLASGQRKWMRLEWLAYLLCFGALETAVVYPVVAILYTRLVARKRGGWELFIPSVIFVGIHFLLISKNTSEIYRLAVDARLPATLLSYLRSTLGPNHLHEFYSPHWRGPVLWAMGATGLALALFLITRLRAHDSSVLFPAAWFLAFLAPVLPLPNHVSDYYLAVPLAGAGWLAGWAIVCAWNSGLTARAVAVVLAGIYLAGSAAEVQASSSWFLARGSEMRRLVRGIQRIALTHPEISGGNSTLILKGVDQELFRSGFQHDPLRLLGVKTVRLTPGSENAIQAQDELGGIAPFRISGPAALDLLSSGHARVIQLDVGDVMDVTGIYTASLRAEVRLGRPNSINVGDPEDRLKLGPSWYPVENGFRWMPKTATIQMPAPTSADQRLYVTGYGPAVALSQGPVTVEIRAGQVKIGSGVVSKPGEQFSFDLPLPKALVKPGNIELTVEVSKTMRPPGDGRELGLVFGTFTIR